MVNTKPGPAGSVGASAGSKSTTKWRAAAVRIVAPTRRRASSSLGAPLLMKILPSASLRPRMARSLAWVAASFCTHERGVRGLPMLRGLTEESESQ